MLALVDSSRVIEDDFFIDKGFNFAVVFLSIDILELRHGSF